MPLPVAILTVLCYIRKLQDPSAVHLIFTVVAASCEWMVSLNIDHVPLSQIREHYTVLLVRSTCVQNSH